MFVDKQVATELRVQGKTYQEIGNIFGVSRQRIHQILTKYETVKGKTREKRRKERQQKKRERRLGNIDGETISDYIKRFNIVRKELVLKHYGNGKLACVKCGFNNISALSIDHINGGGNKHRKRVVHNSGGQTFYRWLVKNNFPEGYQTLCMNCQWIKRMEKKDVSFLSP